MQNNSIKMVGFSLGQFCHVVLCMAMKTLKAKGRVWGGEEGVCVREPGRTGLLLLMLV